jgi:HEXXH motif-containing protein
VLASPEVNSLVLQRLKSVELGKHKTLLASIMRIAAPIIPHDYERALALPYQLLSDVEALAPEAVTELLASPQFGAWANDVLGRLQADAPAAEDDVPLAVDLGHLAAFAAAAAVRANCPFSLEVPLRGGSVSLPAMGAARPGAAVLWEWGRAWLDGTGCHIRSRTATVDIPGDPDISGAGWAGLPRITVSEQGLRLDVRLDDEDPFLDRYGAARVRLADGDLPRWRHLLTAGWRILATDHQALASLFAATVRTVVPLASLGPTRAASSTQETAFGAIALALPADALGMAEVLVHESHHAVLGALFDTTPLTGADDIDGQSGFLAYAPWRDDPRPASALLQGIFAHYGMGRFWRRQYLAGPMDQRERAAVEFGRMRAMTARAVSTLAAAADPAGTGLLTEAGQDFLSGIQREVAVWLDEPLSAAAQEHVADLATDHEARWRLSHLRPDVDAIGALVDAWSRGDPPSFPPDAVRVRLQPGRPPASAANIRSYLLTLRYRWPESLDEAMSGPHDPADAALVGGEYEAAAAGYLDRIAAGGDLDAWAGLATARRRTGPQPVATLLAQRPETVRAIHDLVSAGGRTRDDHTLPDRLAAWLGGTS